METTQQTFDVELCVKQQSHRALYTPAMSDTYHNAGQEYPIYILSTNLNPYGQFPNCVYARFSRPRAKWGDVEANPENYSVYIIDISKLRNLPLK